jgi:oligoribonuclease
MTGLNLASDALIEIAVLVTDSELNLLGDGIDLVIATTPEKLASMSDEVKRMHSESGLIEEVANGVSLSIAEERILEYLRQYTAEGKSPLAGNSVGMDRNFIARDMPLLNSFLHYRTIDVSSIKELAKRWYPKAYFQPLKNQATIEPSAIFKIPLQNLLITALLSLFLISNISNIYFT